MNAPSSAPAWPLRGRSQWLLLAGAATLLVAGLAYSFARAPAEEQLSVVYGRRRGAGAVQSVAGTSVLAGMFERAGCRVRSANRISPKVLDCDVIVWAPDSFAAPDADVIEAFDDWLSEYHPAGRTLIYIGRDWDPATAYYQAMRGAAPPDQAEALRRELARTRSEYERRRAAMPEKEHVEWFEMRRDGERRKGTSLAGPWAEGIDSAAAEIELWGRLAIPRPASPPAAAPSAADPDAVDPKTSEPSAGTSIAGVEPAAGGGGPEVVFDPALHFEPLLTSQGEPIATLVTSELWFGGQLIVVQNGSFLLNYGLVNHEHRKLAGKLIDQCGSPPPRDVVFLESGPEGPAVLDKEPEAGGNGLQVLKVWPLNAILLQLAGLGIVFCLAVAPIFGRPRELPGEPQADFGRHVSALGELLSRTRDVNYAQHRLQYYRQHAQRGSGKGHALRKGPSSPATRR